jgi:hypothetical protein
VHLLERLTADPWTRTMSVLGAGTVGLLACYGQYAALPGAAVAVGAALVIGARASRQG